MFGSSSDQSLNIIVRLQDEASKALNDLESKISKFSKSIEPAAAASRKFALGLTAVATAVGGFGIMALRSAADAEQTRIAFETMLGSTEKAATFIKELVAFAAKTPFELKGLESSVKGLMAMGVEADKALPTLKVLGDIAAGVGMDKLPQLTLAFGQVKAATRLTGMELRQFTEAGVPLLQTLATQMGKTVGEIQTMVSEGKIGFAEVEKALTSMTVEGGKFNNLMDKQAKSLGGMWSNLQDAWEQFLRGEGAKLIEWGKKFVAFLIDLVEDKLPKWIKKIEDLTNWLKKHEPVLWAVAGAITIALLPAVVSATAAFAAWAIAMAPFILIGAAIGLVVGAVIKYRDEIKEFFQMIDEKTGLITMLKEAWDKLVIVFNEELKPALQELWLKLKELWATLEPYMPYLQILGKILAVVIVGSLVAVAIAITGVIEFLTKLIAMITKVATFIVDTFIDAFNKAKNIINDVIDAVQRLIDKLSQLNLVQGAKNLFNNSLVGQAVGAVRGAVGLAEGGIVTKPTLAMIGEGGESEAVIPLSKMGSIGGGGINVTINYPEFKNSDDENKMRKMLDDYFRPILINNKI